MKEIKINEIVKSLPTTEDMMRGAPEGTFSKALLDGLNHIHSYYLANDTHSMQFTEVEEDTHFSQHAHGDQWTIVLAGTAIFEYEDGRCEEYNAGDTYFITGGIKHVATLKKGYRDVTVLKRK